MVKKILSLTVAIMLLSVTAFATVTTPLALAQESEAVATVSVESSPTVDNNALTGSAQLKITAATDKEDVTVVTGVFSTEGDFLGAAVEEAFNLTAGVAVEKTIAMPTVSVTEDSKYVVNFYLWEKNTLAPITGVTSISVEPAAPAAPAVWDGETVTAAEKLQVATANDLGEAYTGYYMIKSGADLAGFANLVNSGDTTANAVLCNDIYLNAQTGDLTDYTNNWKSYVIGTENSPYAGTFDGNGNTIYGLYLNDPSSNSGMFGSVTGGTITDLTLEGAYLLASFDSKSSTYVGMLAGKLQASSKIERSVVSGKIEVAKGKYSNACGGLVGLIVGGSSANDAATISNCTSNVNINLSNGGSDVSTHSFPYSANFGIGGIVGVVNTKYAIVKNCTNTGDINAPRTDFVAGIIGNSKGASSSNILMPNLKDNTNSGDITAYFAYDDAMNGIYGYGRKSNSIDLFSTTYNNVNTGTLTNTYVATP